MIYLRMLDPDCFVPSEIKALIHSIWPDPYAVPASVATVEDGLYTPTNQIFLIYESNYSQNREPETLVGITGYFDIDSHAGQAYLRWTGIVPSARNRKVFANAMRLLALQLNGANPSLNRLIELVPDNEYGRTVVMPAFERVGFKPRPDLPIPKGEDDEWSVIPYVYNF